MSLTVRDSIRFEDTDGLAQQAPDETTDLMRNILSLALLADINGLGMIDLSLHSDMTYSNLASDVVTVNGDGSFDFDMDVETEDGSISGNVSATLDINDLTIPKPSFEGEMTCPTSGEIVLMVTENLTAQAVNEGVISVTWKLTVTVLSGNSYKIKLEGGGQNFGEVTINDACSESLSLTNRFPTSVTGVMKSFDPQR
jgi:hypothetical protein